MSELIKKEKPRLIKLGDKEYKLSPLNLNVMAGIEEEFGGGMEKIGEMMTEKMATSLRTLIYVLLKDNYPDMTKTKIGQLITTENLGEISSQIGEILTGKE